MAKKQISKSGAAKLWEELDYLVTVRRAEMAQKLKEARAQGDLSENAEYDEAKNEQAIMEAQIMEIQYTLDNSEIVDDNASIDEVGLGSTIKIKNFRTGKIETLQIVSSNEANFKEGKISDESPIGKGCRILRYLLCQPLQADQKAGSAPSLLPAGTGRRRAFGLDGR